MSSSSSSDSEALKPTANSDADDSKHIPYFWMLKPCETYKEEYKDCKSFKDRFHQRYVHGDFRECGQWNVDHENCLKWEKNQDEEALQKVIESEKQRVKERLRAHYANDVWEHREQPPADWNKELPEEIRQKYEGSYLQIKAEELRSGKEFVPEKEYIVSDGKCSIQ